MAAMTSFQAKKVLPSGECTGSVCLVLCSSLRQFLIYSTFLLHPSMFICTKYLLFLTLQSQIQ